MSTGAPQAGSGVNSAIFEYNAQTGAFIDAFVPAGSGGLDGGTGFTFTPQASPPPPPAPIGVPEPSTFTLLGIGIARLLGYHWRRRKQAKA